MLLGCKVTNNNFSLSHKTDIMEFVHSENHFEELHLRRVCGGCSKKFAESSVKSCDIVVLELKSFHGTDITQNTTNICSQTLTVFEVF